MQPNTNWQKVKDHILRDRKPIEREFNLKVGAEKGEWSVCGCPLHPDSDASASLSRKGGLRCHVGCTDDGGKDGMDVFQWVAKLEGITQVEALERIGRIYSVDTDLKKMPPRPRTKGRVALADEDMASTCAKALIESDDPRAKFYRDFLRSRHLDPELVAKNDVGYDEKTKMLCFFQRDRGGVLAPYWRTFEIVSGEKQWRWTGSRTAMQGLTRALWPLCDVGSIAPGDTVWIVEGEWDALTARCRLRWQDGKPPIHVLSVTHGKQGLRLPAGQVPEVLRECRVVLAFDNDVWQSPDTEALLAPSAQERMVLEKAQESFLRDALEFHRMLGERDLHVAAVPLPGDVAWKADLRDWCDAGGCDPKDWSTWRFEDLRPDIIHPEQVTFETVGEHLNKLVTFDASVDAVMVDNVIAPHLIDLKCEAGAKPYCATCDALVRYTPTNWMIAVGDEMRREMTIREGRELERYVRDNVLGRPHQCQSAQLIDVTYDKMRRWGAGPRIEVAHTQDDDVRVKNERSLLIVSKDAPPMSGNVRVVGWVMRQPHTRANSESICIFAEKVDPIDRVEIDVEDFHADLMAVQGHDRTVDEVDQAVHDYVHDLAANTTHIYGLDEMHIGVMLTLCSVLWMPDPDGGVERLRGWIDSIYFGDTGAGKTPIAERLYRAVGGTFHSSPGNTSRAGFVLASMNDPVLGGFVTKPGTLVKNHGGALAVDEAQLLTNDVFDACQSARTNGVVKSGKAGGGDRSYPAAVRCAWLANWIKGQRDNYLFACEHVAQLCGMKDESVRRFDFALAVAGVHDWESETHAHLLKPDLLRALVGRAWTIKPTQIDFEDGCWELAKRIVRAAAARYWPYEVPLFIASEKDKSVMRIACAVANLLYSHPVGHPRRLLVRKTHVEWAMLWLERTFVSIEYTQFSRQRLEAETVICPYHAEISLTLEWGVKSPLQVKQILQQLQGSFTQAEIDTIFKTPEASRVWVAKARALNVANKSTRIHPGRNTPTMRLTQGAQAIRRAWIALLEEKGDISVRHRMSVLKNWQTENVARNPGEGSIPDLPPLTEGSIKDVLDHDYPDREEDIGAAEPMF